MAYAQTLLPTIPSKISMSIDDAIVTKVHYLNDKWGAFKIKCSKGNLNCSGKLDFPIAVGDKIRVEGLYYIDQKYGPKIDIEKVELFTKNFNGSYSETLIFNYLISSAVKYVNEEKAKEMVNKFGEKVIDIARTTPEDLASIKGIGKKTAKKVAESIVLNASLIEIMSLLPGITMLEAETLYKKYGKATIAKLQKNPYTVMYDLERYGFKRADKLAMRMGISMYDKKRIGAAVYYLIDNAANFGHCFVKVDGIEELLVNANNALLPELKDNETLIAEAIADEIKEGHLVLDGVEDLYVASCYEAETKTAKYIAKLATKSPNFSISNEDLNYAIKSVAYEALFELDNTQKQAVKTIFNHTISVITGGPGSGKTTIVNTIKKCYEASAHKGPLVLLAPTGKAANRMKEVTNYGASTIHSIITKINMDIEKYNKSLFIVDESSMIDLMIAYALLRLVVKTDSAIVFIGDKDQLPPIGAGTFFCDLIANKNIASSLLSISHRQVGTIAKNANSINEGFSTKAFQYDEHFRFIHAETAEIHDKIVAEYKKLLQTYDIKDICVLVPRRKKAVNNTAESYSSEDLNPCLMELANPVPPNKTPHSLKGFKLGDRVMQTVNDKKRKIYNGDVCTVTSVDIKNRRLGLMTDQGWGVYAENTEISDLRLAYALTIHKSQGSEYKATIVALSSQDYTMLQRNLLYTAVTRAKDKLILIGSPQAVNMAINQIDAFQRNTKLNARINSEINKLNS